MKKKLRIAILGMSEGNGHPYSWSAIFNGYNPEVMKGCPFLAIPEYLSQQKFPQDSIQDGEVTHVWTQDKELSKHVAAACYIPNVVNGYQEMIGHVDAVLLARDDAENHFEMSKSFLEANLPIYIDKPIATKLTDLEKIYSIERYNGQIFSCSALKYAKEFKLSEQDREVIGEIKYLDACVMKSWDRYAVHVIDPILDILGNQGEVLNVSVAKSEDQRVVTVKWQSNVQATITTLGSIQCPIVIRVFGTKGMKELRFVDTFSAFKKTLEVFVASVKNCTVAVERERLKQVVRIVEEGNCG